MRVLAPREAYRLWARSYEAETAISQLEDTLVRSLSPSPRGRRLADIGCGTARRLPKRSGGFAVGVDLTPEMLLAGGGVRARRGLVAGDLRALPLANASFDLVWCRLVVGHLPELSGAYRELSRICQPGGIVVVTDFHPDAVAAGHRRTFKDAAGVTHQIEHHLHSREAHLAWAGDAGLEMSELRDGRVGPAIRPFYERMGKVHLYQQQRGLAVVLAIAFRRPPHP